MSLKEFKKICAAWKTDSWLWFRIFLTDMIIYQARVVFNLPFLFVTNHLHPFFLLAAASLAYYFSFRIKICHHFNTALN